MHASSKAATRPLLARLEELEQERASLANERQRLEREVLSSTIRRPDAGQVQRLWGRMLELWELATDSERIAMPGRARPALESAMAAGPPAQPTSSGDSSGYDVHHTGNAASLA